MHPLFPDAEQMSAGLVNLADLGGLGSSMNAGLTNAGWLSVAAVGIFRWKGTMHLRFFVAGWLLVSNLADGLVLDKSGTGICICADREDLLHLLLFGVFGFGGARGIVGGEGTGTCITWSFFKILSFGLGILNVIVAVPE